MSRIASFCITGLLAACLSAGDAAPDPNANAALDWWRAIHFLGEDKDRLGKLGDDDALKQRLPDPAVDAAFAQPLRVLNLLALGAASTYCDWGIDARGEGAGALLPHLQPMRKLTRLVLLRARWQSAQGRHAEAADDLLLAMRTARLLGGRTPFLMDTLVGFSIETQAIAVAGTLLPALDQAARQRLEAGLAALPTSASVADALAAEAASVQWAVDHLLAQPPMKRPAFFAALGGGGSGLDALRLLPEVTDEKLRALPGQYAVELARWQAHLRKPPAERLPFPEVWSGGKSPNALLDVMMPAFPHMAQKELQLLQRRQMLRAALARFASGDAGLATMPDPLSGKPFACAATPGGFRLSVVWADDAKPVELEVGTAPVPAEGKAPAGF
jgi:hypothetical protein